MRQWKRLLVSAGLMTAMTVTPVCAAGWQWMDQNNDNVSECYYVQDDGTVLSGTTTPDGYTVNEQGAWVVDGVVQTQSVQSPQSGTGQVTAPRLTRNYTRTSQLSRFGYVLYSPANPGDDMALIVYLHGHNLGDDLTDLTKDLQELRKEADKRSNAFILAPLLPPELDRGDKGMWMGIQESVMELIESVVTTYKIDRDRVSVMGMSMGADSAIRIAAAYPEVFSCCVGIVPFHENSPMAKWEKGWGEQVKTTPAWFFVEDETSARNLAKTVADDITAAGGQAWVEVMEGANHGRAADRAESKMGAGGYGIYDWMVSVKKVR